MATLEQEQDARKKLTEVLGGLKTIDADSLARTDVLGKDLSFKDGVPTFKRTWLCLQSSRSATSTILQPRA